MRSDAQAMTRMSESSQRLPQRSGAKPLQSRRRLPLARTVHALRFVVGSAFTVGFATTFGLVAGAAGAAGCVIPPSLSLENQDAGLNSPPAILMVTSDQQALA